MESLTEPTEKQTDFSALPPLEINNLIRKKDNQLLTLDIQIKTLTEKLNWFEEQLKLGKHKQFAASSEKQSTLQAELFDENEDELQTSHEDDGEKEKITYERRKANRRKKNVDTSALPREKHYIDLSDEEKQCDCGRCMEKFGEESKEELVFKPATLKVIEHIRIKYTCRHCKSVKMPKAVELPLSKSAIIFD